MNRQLRKRKEAQSDGSLLTSQQEASEKDEQGTETGVKGAGNRRNRKEEYRIKKKTFGKEGKASKRWDKA